MTNERIMALWQDAAIQIGHQVRATVNTPDMIGGDYETGYLLMFFSAKPTDDKCTLVSSEQDRARVKRLLKFALANLKRASLIEPGREH